jgi:hypothetical protein
MAATTVCMPSNAVIITTFAAGTRLRRSGGSSRPDVPGMRTPAVADALRDAECRCGLRSGLHGRAMPQEQECQSKPCDSFGRHIAILGDGAQRDAYEADHLISHRITVAADARLHVSPGHAQQLSQLLAGVAQIAIQARVGLGEDGGVAQRDDGLLERADPVRCLRSREVTGQRLLDESRTLIVRGHLRVHVLAPQGTRRERCRSRAMPVAPQHRRHVRVGRVTEQRVREIERLAGSFHEDAAPAELVERPHELRTLKVRNGRDELRGRGAADQGCQCRSASN